MDAVLQKVNLVRMRCMDLPSGGKSDIIKSQKDVIATLMRCDNAIAKLHMNRIALKHGREGARLAWQQLAKFDRDRVSFHNPYYKGIWTNIDMKELRRQQRSALRAMTEDEISRYYTRDESRDIHLRDSKIWIPATLFERLLVHSHVASRHGSLRDQMEILDTYSIDLPARYYEANVSTKSRITDLVRELRRRCIHCIRDRKSVV